MGTESVPKLHSRDTRFSCDLRITATKRVKNRLSTENSRIYGMNIKELVWPVSSLLIKTAANTAAISDQAKALSGMETRLFLSKEVFTALPRT